MAPEPPSHRSFPLSVIRDTPFPAAELAVVAAFLGAALLAIAATRVAGGVALIWPANAIAAALLIRNPGLRVMLTLSLVLVASVLANIAAAGDSLANALSFSLVNVAEAGLMVWAYRRRVGWPVPDIDIYRAAHMAALFGLAIPAIAAVPGGLLAHAAFHVPAAEAMVNWWLSDAVGACLFGPPIILYKQAAARRLISPRYAVQNAFFTLSCLAFSYIAIRYVRFPFVVVAVPLLVGAFSVGAFGAAVLSSLVGLTVIGFWVMNIRPSGLDVTHHVSLLVGLPVWALIATAMPPIAVGLGADERRRGARALRSSERRFRESLERSPIGTVLADLDGRWTETNAALQRMLGYSAAEFRALPRGALSHPDDREDIERRWQDLLSGAGEFYETERRFLHKNGSWVWTHAAIYIVRDDEGRPMHYIAQMESLQSRRAAELALAEERERLNITLRVIADAVVTTDAQRQITYMNAAAERILGQALTDVRSRRLDEVMALTDPVSLKPCPDLVGQCLALAQVVQRDRASVLHRSDGSVSYVTVCVSPVAAHGERVTGAVIVLRDDTERYYRERELTDRARRDALTGLSNRYEFERRAKRAFERARLLGVPAAVVAIDLDRFKAVNDLGGHAAGDAVLRRVAEVLRARVRSSDTVARLGGDEFALILENCTPERIRSLVEGISKALNPLETEWESTVHVIGASLGVAAASEQFPDDVAWLAAADQACYDGKRTGRGKLRSVGLPRA